MGGSHTSAVYCLCVIHILSIFLQLLNISWNYFFVFDYPVENRLKGEAEKADSRKTKVHRPYPMLAWAPSDNTVEFGKEVPPGRRTYGLLVVWDGFCFLFCFVYCLLFGDFVFAYVFKAGSPICLWLTCNSQCRLASSSQRSACLY